MKPTAACRLYVLQARDGESAVIFRKGPRNNMLLVRWNLKNDTFEEGQWVKHKIYVRRCDLSPDGEFLIYFAAKFKGPLYSWTAISKPPFFHALSLWPKIDAWGGGGLFEGKRRVMLNHLPHDMVLAPTPVRQPKWQLAACGDYSGRGEDNPIEHMRLSRGGWNLENRGEARSNSRKRSTYITLDPPEVYASANPKQPSIALRRIRTDIFEKQGKLYVEHFVVSDDRGIELRRFAKFDWADWCENGDLLLADAGRVWRLRSAMIKRRADDPLEGAKLLVDLSDRTFEAIAAPRRAQTW